MVTPLPPNASHLTFCSRHPLPATSQLNRQTHRLSIHLPPPFLHPRHRRHRLLHSPYLRLHPPRPQRPPHRTIHPLQPLPPHGRGPLFTHHVRQDRRIRLVPGHTSAENGERRGGSVTSGRGVFGIC